MTDQEIRFTKVRSFFPDRLERKYCVASFYKTASDNCSVEPVYDLAEARRVTIAVCADDKAQAEIYRFDGADLWLLVA